MIRVHIITRYLNSYPINNTISRRGIIQMHRHQQGRFWIFDRRTGQSVGEVDTTLEKSMSWCNAT